MNAAMAAAVSAASTSRLVSGPLSGKLALVDEPGPLDEAELGTGAGACAAGRIKATGCANVMAGTGALLTGALWRPTE
jgi:hypothetical protein